MNLTMPAPGATRSGDYQLASRFHQHLGNVVLGAATLAPRWFGRWFLGRRGSYYQVSSVGAVGNFQGVSENKWAALPVPSRLAGKSVLDIGCSEGFFVQQCAKRGAGRALGVDNSLGRLLTASFQSRLAGLDIRYRMGVFPGPEVRGTFDYVLCLSVLHHTMRKKDLWKVLTEPEYHDDLQVLRDMLQHLRALTATSGTCIVEMPFEYDDPVAERQVVDFELFSRELLAAGFTAVKVQGTWDYNPDHVRFKDRIIYVAQA